MVRSSQKAEMNKLLIIFGIILTREKIIFIILNKLIFITIKTLCSLKILNTKLNCLEKVANLLHHNLHKITTL